MTQQPISRRTVLRGLGASLALSGLNPARASGSAQELWFLLSVYPGSPADVSALETRIDEAISYGYTGVAFLSSAFAFMGSTVYPATNVAYMQQIISYARAKGLQTMATTSPYGYSDDALINNHNWAEGQHVTGSTFTVNASRTALVPVNSYGGLVNPGFEAGMTGWFSLNDPNMGIDNTVAHSGTSSGYVTNATGDSRFKQTLNLTPWRQYHARIWYKTSNFQGYAQVEVWDPATNIVSFYAPVGLQSNQDWTEAEFTFNSRGSSQPSLLFGVWGGCTGTIWFDDVFIEETALVYVLRRAGTPLNVYDPANPGTIFQEGIDFNPIADPRVGSGAYYPFTGYYHAPVTVTLPPATTLQAGQTVAIDYYAVQLPEPTGDVGMCLTEPAAQNWLLRNMQALTGNMPPGMSYLLSYDEMRHMNSCASCKAKNLSAGELLAWHVTNTAALCLSLAPGAALYIWSDMFDPYANAIDDYYFVEGDIAGSWAGLPAGVTILNWNLSNLSNSLAWFSGLTSAQPIRYSQLIAGYYDSGDGAGSATVELQQAAGIPGVTGLMYVTWSNDYSQLEAFATAAKNNWAAYAASLAANVTVLSLGSLTADGTYGAGSVILISLAFSSPVGVTGSPRIALNSGGAAAYTSGSGTNALIFTYTIAAGQSSAWLDAASAASLTLQGGAIVGANSLPANLTLPVPGTANSLAANAKIAVATGKPLPIDYSGQVKVTSSGLVYSRATATYSGSLTILNTGSTPIPGPLELVLSNLIAGASLANETGLVPRGAYVGMPYITLAGSTPLAPGTSVVAAVKFAYKGTAPISYSAGVLSGGF